MLLSATIAIFLSWTVAGFITIAGQSGVQPRLEIGLLAQSLDEWVIFILAMQKFQQTAESNVDSYFSICGIHGSPHAYWDNNPRVQPSVANSNLGYCFHGTEQFYLWHRPYLLLFERIVIKNARQVANSFRDPWLKALYTTAAGRLRLPFWDWARDSNVPSQLTDQFVSVDDPSSGQKKSIPNPLLSYTIRTPKAVQTLTKTTRGANYLRDMANIQNELRQSVAIMFNTPGQCWNEFATYAFNEHQQCGSQALLNSLESIHNTIHNTIGGTMFWLDIAAFDPIFWLHHVSVDRLGMLWQALNPSTFVTRTQTYMGNYVQRSQILVDANTPLYPFHRDQNTWWTSTMCRNVQDLGYTYVELEGSFASSSSLQDAVQARVNALYGTGRILQGFKTRKRRLRKRQPLNGGAPSDSSLERHVDSLISTNGSFSDYAARITLGRAAFPSTFTVHLFLGDPPSDLKNVLSSVTRVGGFSVLTNAGMRDSMVTGVVVLTNALLNQIVRGSIKDLDPHTIKTYCDKNLQWKILGADGKDYSDDAQKAGLEIQVFRTEVTPDGGQDKAPRVSDPEDVLAVDCTKRGRTG